MDHPGLAIACAESVAFLYLLHQVPSQVLSNPVPKSPPYLAQDYFLPFEKERNLASILAFLSCTKHDPNRIPALCVKEDQHKMSLEVFVAVNEERVSSASQERSSIKKSLQFIFDAVPASVESKTLLPSFSSLKQPNGDFRQGTMTVKSSLLSSRYALIVFLSA